MNDPAIILSIAVIGGTGKEGKGLAYRWAKAGYRVLIGSRQAEKARACAAELAGRLQGEADIHGLENLEAARQADIVVLTVPYEAHRPTLEALKESLAGKMLVDVTVPLVPPQVTVARMPPAGSAALEARQILGNEAAVAAAFENISSERLLADEDPDCDVLVCGSDKQTRAQTLRLVAAAGFTGWDAGALENSMVVEGLTSILIHINKRYGSTRAGIRISGVERQEPAGGSG